MKGRSEKKRDAGAHTQQDSCQLSSVSRGTDPQEGISVVSPLDLRRSGYIDTDSNNGF